MSFRSFKPAVLALAAVMALPALAQTSASTSVTGLTFELIDLDINDGITASLVWGESSALTQVTNRYGQSFDMSTIDEGATVWGAVTFGQMASESSSSIDSFVSSSAFGSGSASASTTSGGLINQSSTVSGGQDLSTFSYLFGDFTLSANTELRVTGFAQSSVLGTDSSQALLPPGGGLGDGVLFSQVSTFTQLVLGDVTFEQMLSDANYLSNSLPFFYPTAAYSGFASSDFSLTLSNTGSDALTSYFSVMSQTNLVQMLSQTVPPVDPTPTAPVPEPATWALMGMGLVGVGLARRKKRNT